MGTARRLWLGPGLPATVLPSYRYVGIELSGSIEGTLVRDGGCIRVETPSGAFVPIWPRGTALSAAGVQLPAANGGELIAFGRRVALRGGRNPGSRGDQELQRRQPLRGKRLLGQQCPGTVGLGDNRVRCLSDRSIRRGRDRDQGQLVARLHPMDRRAGGEEGAGEGGASAGAGQAKGDRGRAGELCEGGLGAGDAGAGRAAMQRCQVESLRTRRRCS